MPSLSDTQRENTKKLIVILSRRLQKLKEQQALHGASVDPRILIEIEDIEEEIEELQTQLKEGKEIILQADDSISSGVHEESQTASVRCQECGSENRPQARFCWRCGQPMSAEVSPSIEAKHGGQVAVDDGINIQIGEIHGGQVNISPAKPMPQEPSAAVPAPAQPASFPEQDVRSVKPFKLQLIQRSDLEFEIRASDTPLGEPQATGRLPYKAEELVAVLKALRAAEHFSPAQLDTLQQLGLMTEANIAPDLHQRVGQHLYNTLMPKDIHTAFQMALSQARPVEGTVALQMRFDENAVELAQYPWELLYSRRTLLPSRAVELTRYISYPEAVTPLSVAPPLKLLYIQARPTDLPVLPEDSEQATIRQALDALAAENILKVEVLPRPTYEALLDYLETETVHIFHFDGHGVFARQCPVCGAMNYPRATHCQAPQDGSVCGQTLAHVAPQGYLAFEDTDRQVRWIRSETLGNLIFNRPIRLAVLSACRSSNVGGETLFGGTAPALIQAGVPAVVSTQLPISVAVAVKFMRGFYRALARFESVPAAVNAGRLHVFDTGEWFIPTLYLRSQDDEGYLFQQKET